MEIEEFRENLLNDISADALLNSIYEDVSFLNYMREHLRETGNCSELNECYYNRPARDNRYKSMHIDAYSLERADNSLYLFIGDYNNGEIKTINTEILDKNMKSMYAFVENLIKGFFTEGNIEKSSQIYAVASDIYSALTRKEIDRVHLLFATTNMIGNKVKLKDYGTLKYNDRELHFDVTYFDINDLYKYNISNEDTESIEINTKDFDCEGIPCLQANLGSSDSYAAYLAIVPGIFLATIYRKFGGKLLESNVRAFLNVRGNVNKGIRNTILHEETKFFTYNNGIACTADEIVLNKEGTKIIAMKNFQIVNGGQTTASLANAIIKDGAEENVKRIYVPMKLTVLAQKDPELVADISKYANSQNKVTASDLVSNNKFYIALEKLSRKYLTPKNVNTNYQTYWYFERSRGQYERDLARCLKKSEKDKFKTINPKSQLIKKPDIAKYYNSYELLPFNVAWGAEVNAAKFQNTVDTTFNKDESIVNEFFYKSLIAKAILFIEARKITSQTEWYKNHTGILAQVSPYVVSKLIYQISQIDNGNWMLNLKWIWENQKLSEATINEILRAGEVVWKVVSDESRPLINIAEWCKREACWDMVKKARYELTPEFKKELILKSDLEEAKAAAKKDQRSEAKTEYAVEIFKLGSQYWATLLDRAKLDGLVGPREVSFIQAAIKACNKMNLVSDAQANAIHKIVKDLEAKGLYIKKD